MPTARRAHVPPQQSLNTWNGVALAPGSVRPVAWHDCMTARLWRPPPPSSRGFVIRSPGAAADAQVALRMRMRLLGPSAAWRGPVLLAAGSRGGGAAPAQRFHLSGLSRAMAKVGLVATPHLFRRVRQTCYLGLIESLAAKKQHKTSRLISREGSPAPCRTRPRLGISRPASCT